MVEVAMTLNSGVRGRIFFLLFLSNYQELLSPLEETLLCSVGCLPTSPEVDVSTMTYLLCTAVPVLYSVRKGV